MSIKNLTGKRYGRLLVVAQSDNKSNRTAWLCDCDCGNQLIVLGQSIKSGHTKSCGCYARENAPKCGFKHGHSPAKGKSLEYSSWTSMIQRCTNVNSKAYSGYGGRGITVCERWMKFDNFLEDMGFRPGKNFSLDRINNDDGYYLKNCRWATKKTQQRNMRSNHRLTYNGQNLTIVEWAENTGLTTTTIRNRIRSGWKVSHALSVPSDDKHLSIAINARKALLQAEEESHARS